MSRTSLALGGALVATTLSLSLTGSAFAQAPAEPASPPAAPAAELSPATDAAPTDAPAAEAAASDDAPTESDAEDTAEGAEDDDSVEAKADAMEDAAEDLEDAVEDAVEAKIDLDEDREEEEEEEGPYTGPATLMGGDREDITIGGYGGLSVLGTSINSNAAMLIGLEGGVILNRSLIFGAAAYGLASEIDGPDFANGNQSNLGVGYGGFMMRYQYPATSAIYGSVGVLVGGGGVSLLERIDRDGLEIEYNSRDYKTDSFFVVEPSLQGHANLTRWMRIGVHASYRITQGVGRFDGIEEKQLGGPSFGANLHFGWL